jgi:hypothetical protein
MKEADNIPSAIFWVSAIAVSCGIQVALVHCLSYHGWSSSSEYWLRQILNPPSMAWVVGIIPTFSILAYLGIRWPRWILMSWFFTALAVASVSYWWLIPRIKA